MVSQLPVSCSLTLAYLLTDGVMWTWVESGSGRQGFWEPQFTDSFLGLTDTWPASPWPPGLYVYRPSHSLDFTLNLSAFVPPGGKAGVLVMPESAHLPNAGYRTTLGDVHYSHPTHRGWSSCWFSG